MISVQLFMEYLLIENVLIKSIMNADIIFFSQEFILANDLIAARTPTEKLKWAFRM